MSKLTEEEKQERINNFFRMRIETMIFENKICFDGTHIEGLYRDKNIALARGSDDKQGYFVYAYGCSRLIKEISGSSEFIKFSCDNEVVTSKFTDILMRHIWG